jgi:hypothetical protein
MHALDLTPDEFREITRCCERVLLNEFTPAADLQRFLVVRLRDAFPATAARVERFSEAEVLELSRQVLRLLRLNPASTGSS